MNLLSKTIVLTTSLYSVLAAGEACVIGGPAARVDVGGYCCFETHGKWFQNYPDQGICVFAESYLTNFTSCFNAAEADYTPTCIQCDETNNCGLSPTS